MALLLLVASSAARAGGGGEGDLPDPCKSDLPPDTRSILHCRDGDPRCDMDGMCDGTCFLKSCIVQPENPASCLVTSRFCPRSGSSVSLYYAGTNGPWLIPVGEVRTFRYQATVVGAVCKPARRRCVPPNPPPCVVTMTGDLSASFACDVHLVAPAPDRLMPSRFEIVLRDRGSFAIMRILVVRRPATGTFTADAPDRVVEQINLETADFEYVDADNFDPSRGSLDATLVLDQVGASRTHYHEAHGTFDAVAVGRPQNHPGMRAFTVHARF